MMMKRWLVLLAGAMLGSSVDGAVIGTATLERDPPGLPFSAPDTALGPPWVAYSLALQSTDSKKIAALDIRINGPLHQRWVYNDNTAAFDPTPISLDISSGDSHLLAEVSQTLFVIGPSEDNTGIGSPLIDTAAADYGVGSMLRGVWAYVSSQHATSHTFAYIVMPCGQLSALDIEVQSASPDGEIFNTLTERDFFPNVPEPSTIALLGVSLAGLGLGVRRRASQLTIVNSVVRSALAVVIVMGLAVGLAEAAVIGTSTLRAHPPDVPFTAPDSALGSDWVSYALDLSTTAGELIGGIDVEIKGPLHQRWVYDEDLGTYQPTASSAGQSNGDSHLRALVGALFALGPSEDNSGTGSPLSDTATADYGMGSNLRGIWGITNAAATASLAYIVVPKNQEPFLDINVKVANPAGEIIGQLDNCSFFLCARTTVIGVSGNGVPIENGDTTPSFLDSTDFGGVLPSFPPENSDAYRTFTITASGDGPLTLQAPVFTGPFSILGDFPTVISAGSSADFKIQLNSNVLFGHHYGTISIPNDSVNAPIFNFSLHAATPEPSSGALLALALGSIPCGCRRGRK